MNNQKTIIQVQDVTIAYDDFIVMKDINFEIMQGEIFAILGGSGCGKSTLLKNMISLYKPVTGKILIDGKNIVTAQGMELREILSSIGVMYQQGALFGTMNILENICLVLEEFTSLPKDAMEFIAMMKLKVVGLEDSAYKMPSELSGGMRKRAAIARAMALDPKIIFLDEPGAGLDPITSAQLDELIVELAQTLKITFVIVTHELDSILSIADRVIMLDKNTKTIIASGNPTELRDKSPNPWVKQFFNRLAKADVQK